jgi:hypothetical protein
MTQSNKRMHATADTQAVISGYLAGRRVMRGVMPPLPAPAGLIGRLRAIERCAT